MNINEMDTEVCKLADERGWGNWRDGDQRTVMLFHLLDAREEARRCIQLRIESLRQDLDRLEKVLARPNPILNTLGELQYRPASVEVSVGEFAAADKALRRYLETFPAKGGEGDGPQSL